MKQKTKSLTFSHIFAGNKQREKKKKGGGIAYLNAGDDSESENVSPVWEKLIPKGWKGSAFEINEMWLRERERERERVRETSWEWVGNENEAQGTREGE